MPLHTQQNSFTTNLFVISCLLISINQCSASDLPTVSELLLETPFSSKHTQEVLAGKISTTDIVPVSDNELAQGVACLVKKGTPKDLDSVHLGTWLAPEQHIILSALISDNASISDFKTVHFNTEHQHELQRFINAEGGYELNLSLQETRKFNQLNAIKNKQRLNNDTEQLIQGLLLERYNQYRKLEVTGIAPYARNDAKETQPGKQLITSLEESLRLKKLYPKLYRLLKQYPHSVDLPVTESFFWYLVNLGDRPAVGLSHRIHSDLDIAILIIERGYYISHTIDSVQVLVGLIPVQEGMLLIYINRTWTEEVSGLFSLIKRKVAHNIMISEMEHVMKNIHICINAD